MAKKKKVMRTNMHNLLQVLRLKFEQRFSFRMVARSLGIGTATVHDIVGRFNNLGLTWPLPEDYPPEKLEEALFPARNYQGGKMMPDWATVDNELTRKGVTKQLLWLEYQSVAGVDAISYSRFCLYYKKWKKSQRLSMRQEHRAGEKLFLDFCGPTVGIVNPGTGEERRVAIFIAVMGVSNYTYIEACEGQDLESWLTANHNCLQFLGGVPELLIPDNLKSGVHKADRYEPEINKSYQSLAEHYKTVVFPARPRRPRDKAKVETGVLIVERWVLARIRNEIFHTRSALNVRLKELCRELNHRPMKGYGGQTREERFRQLDAPALKTLPEYPWEYSEYRRAKVGPDYHVEYRQHWYSVPCSLAGEYVDLKVNRQLIQIWSMGSCVAQHPVSSQPWKHTTNPAHMPEKHRQYGKWTPERQQSWASSVGPSAHALVIKLQQSKPHPEQASRSVMGILSLQKKYGSARLEKACQAALQYGRLNRSFIDNLLKNKREELLLSGGGGHQKQEELPLEHENLRGASYYH